MIICQLGRIVNLRLSNPRVSSQMNASGDGVERAQEDDKRQIIEKERSADLLRSAAGEEKNEDGNAQDDRYGQFVPIFPPKSGPRQRKESDGEDHGQKGEAHPKWDRRRSGEHKNLLYQTARLFTPIPRPNIIILLFRSCAEVAE